MTADDSQDEVSLDVISEVDDLAATDDHHEQDHVDAEIATSMTAETDDFDERSDTAEVNELSESAQLSETAEGREQDEDPQLAELAQPFVGQWNQLISTTNWEKGKIISQWRETLIESGVDSTQYSDDAWARQVGGVTAPHVGRLRRVYDRFGSTYETYTNVFWSHFLAALDWDDAPMWLEGAAQEGWSVSQMREQRWQSLGAVESQRPTNSQIVEVDTDEDIVLPAQGGGKTKDYDGETSGVAAGPIPEGPDFGEEEELASLGGANSGGASGVSMVDEDAPPTVQPFMGLPELPPDMADAIESLKLSVLRHKTDGWRDVEADTVRKYLDAMAVLLTV